MKPDEFFRKNLVPVSFGIQQARDDLRRIQSGETGLKCGLTVLDGYLRFLPTELTVIGARPGTGKTAFAMQMIHIVLKQLEDANLPGCIATFSAEMPTYRLMQREACALEKISLWSALTGGCTAEEYQRLDRRLVNLDNRRLFFDESSAPTIEHMLEQLEAVNSERGPVRLVVFDYTELAGEFDTAESRRVAKISRGLKGIAKQFNVPVLTLSQLNREIEGRAEKRPTMRDLMHGGEREPDRIIVLVRPWQLDPEQPKELITAHVVKNRNGPQGSAQLYFDEETMRFYSAHVERKDLMT